jgi:glucosylceramidase
MVVAVLLAGAALPASTDADGAPSDPYAVEVVQTSANLAQRLTPLTPIHFGHAVPPAGTPVIRVDDHVAYQRVNGFGAAMTDSSAWLIERALPAATRDAVMSALFGPQGIHLGFLRVPIGASDFTVAGRPYSYDDRPRGRTDPSLAHFSIAHDIPYILPALTQARSLDPGIELLASPWSPPGWMKRNGSLDNVDDAGTLLPLAYGPWAAYVVRFLQAYARAGVPITALTPQNEPTVPTAYPGMNISPGSLATWIAHDLVPALRRARIRVRLYGHDLGWSDPLPARAIATGAAARYMSGVAWHCYFGSPDVMAALHARVPRLDQIVDECSPGISAIPTSEVVIASLRDWASSVSLWNLALDRGGGPVQPPNQGCPGCYGLARIDRRTGSMTWTTAYFQLGQASAFVEPGAQRIASNHFVAYRYVRPGVNFISRGLDDVALANPDGTRVLLAYDNGPRPVTFAVLWHGVWFTYTLPAGAMATFVWDRTGL